MAQIPYTSPVFKAEAFNCPFCHAYAEQRWGQPHLIAGGNNHGTSDEFWICRCERCHKFSIWLDGRINYPRSSTTPAPNPDLSDDVKRDYNEACVILNDSPRGATALLRLAIQKLCKGLGETGKNINDDIASLVNKGLPVQVQQALDIVRVVGNNAVHPGLIDLRDDIETATKLFSLVNLIAEVMITQPKHVDELYQTIVPESQRKAIEERNKAASGR